MKLYHICVGLILLVMLALVVVGCESKGDQQAEESQAMDDPSGVEFPDLRLDAVIRAAIETPEAIQIPNGKIQISYLETITELRLIGATQSIQCNSEAFRLIHHEADGPRIQDLEGLQHCTNLVDLTIYSNQISDISVLADLKILSFLSLKGNQIHDIYPLAELVNLTFLNLRDNEITDINPLIGLTDLSHLLISENQISDIRPLLELVALEEVSLDDNPLSDESINVVIPELEARGVEVSY